MLTLPTDARTKYFYQIFLSQVDEPRKLLKNIKFVLVRDSEDL